MSLAKVFTAFLTGSAVSVGLGYVKIRQDVLEAASEVNAEVNELKEEVEKQNRDLGSRIYILEQKLKNSTQNESDEF